MTRRDGGSELHVASRAAEAREHLDALRDRRDAGEQLPRVDPAVDLRGARLVRADLAGLDLTGADLSGLDLSECDLRESRLLGADLEGSILFGADLSDAELLGACLDDCNLTEATLARTGLGRTSAKRALFFGAGATDATFTGADLAGADLRTANLEGCRMLDATLHDASLDRARLHGVDLSGSIVDSGSFRDADLTGARLRGVRGYETANWIGADLREVDFTGAWLLRRHAFDENFIHEFRSQSSTHEWLYRLWWVTSDCGRSLLRWSAWTVVIAVVYAAIYTQVDIDWGEHETALSPVYYSVVTFTTLGYGDVLPGSSVAQTLAMTEVILGYFSLGGMMSILSDKIARRAG